jgi:hypothetical protein
MTTAPSLTDRVNLLEKQQAMLVDCINLILAGRWTGPMPHAQAILQAISPGTDTSGTIPCPFPPAQ